MNKRYNALPIVGTYGIDVAGMQTANSTYNEYAIQPYIRKIADEAEASNEVRLFSRIVDMYATDDAPRSRNAHDCDDTD